jgi:hypothetical protein
MVLTHAQWDEIEKNQIIVSAAPVSPSELGRNKKFVLPSPHGITTRFLTDIHIVLTQK